MLDTEKHSFHIRKKETSFSLLSFYSSTHPNDQKYIFIWFTLIYQ